MRRIIGDMFALGLLPLFMSFILQERRPAGFGVVCFRRDTNFKCAQRGPQRIKRHRRILQKLGMPAFKSVLSPRGNFPGFQSCICLVGCTFELK